ncbi:hypothetical protein [Paenibacillus sp. SYP-B4298]|uniref:hypothetical protein n=1 Tax=Paenibacillus sp. SYP-B4298 TaxID=2996034 RepID=UPI0022DDEFFB|nr:hypothetical protein [Paenibacillus sp. SYP-B4298]
MTLHPSGSIGFEFSDPHSASLAWSMLRELGYVPDRVGERHVQLALQSGDLISALEIAMSYGGRLLERTAGDAYEMNDTAYELDQVSISIPAHMVNEDWVMTEEESGSNGVLEV